MDEFNFEGGCANESGMKYLGGMVGGVWLRCAEADVLDIGGR